MDVDRTENEEESSCYLFIFLSAQTHPSAFASPVTQTAPLINLSNTGKKPPNSVNRTHNNKHQYFPTLVARNPGGDLSNYGVAAGPLT